MLHDYRHLCDAVLLTFARRYGTNLDQVVLLSTHNTFSVCCSFYLLALLTMSLQQTATTWAVLLEHLPAAAELAPLDE